LKIVPEAEDQATLWVRANFLPLEFDKEARALSPGAKIRIQGIISKDSNVVGPMLDNCTIVDRRD
jgi:hypothetical protein